jgi:hypothetical protein
MDIFKLGKACKKIVDCGAIVDADKYWLKPSDKFINIVTTPLIKLQYYLRWHKEEFLLVYHNQQKYPLLLLLIKYPVTEDEQSHKNLSGVAIMLNWVEVESDRLTELGFVD